MSPIENTSSPRFRHAVSTGLLAQAIDVFTLGQILDRIKVEQQSHPSITSIQQTLQNLHRKGGSWEIYKGARWTILSSLAKGTSRWTSFHSFYQTYENLLPQKLQQKWPTLVSTCVGISSSFISTTFVICPIENLKVREMTMQGRSKELKQIIYREGIPFFFKGWTPTCLKQAVSYCSYLIAFEKLKQVIHTINGDTPASIPQKVILGASAGIVSSLFHTPFDMVKTQIQKENPLLEKKILPAAKGLYKKYGITGFYSSLRVKMLRASWNSIITIGVMDYFNTLPRQMKI